MRQSPALVSLIASLTLCLFLPTSGSAQPPVYSLPTIGASAAVQTFNDILTELEWDPAQRGALIIVAPNKITRVVDPEKRSVADLPTKGANGYTVNSLSAPYDLRLIPCGTVAVFAPATMVTLATRLPEPNIFADMPFGDRMNLFRSTLTPEQLRKLTSPEGIGVGDVSGEQRPLFLALLPDQMHIRRYTGDIGAQPSPPIQVTPSQRTGTRISLRKQLDWSFVFEGGGGLLSMGNSYIPPGTVKLSLIPTQSIIMSGMSNTYYGVTLREKQSSRLKQGDLPLDWNALNPMVSLEGAKTVGELIDRIRQATGVEIYADTRYSSLKVHLRGASARAGDILTALCYGVTGTFRKVGTIYILTNDRAGFVPRIVNIRDWLLRGEGALQSLLQKIAEKAEQQPPTEIPWNPEDPNTPSTELQKNLPNRPPQLRSVFVNGTSVPQEIPTIPISDLPPGIQASIRSQLENRPAPPIPGQPERTLRTDAVTVYTREQTFLVIPGIGAVEAEGFNISTRPLQRRPSVIPPLPANSLDIPDTLTDRALVIAPQDIAETQALIRAAGSRSYKKVWLAVLPTDQKLLEVAIQEGQAAGVRIGAFVRVLRAGGDTTLPLDRNPLGESSLELAARRVANPEIMESPSASEEQKIASARILADREKRWGDWIRCDQPEVRAKLVTRIATLARIPGLDGIALTDLVAPGYEADISGLTNRAEGETSFGYTEEMRQAFIRQYSIDPIDFGIRDLLTVQGRSFLSLSLLYFEDYGLTGKYSGGMGMQGGTNTYDLGAKDAAEKWIEFRVAAANAHTAAFVQEIRTAVPDVVLWSCEIGNEDAPEFGVRWIARIKPGQEGIASLTPAPVPKQVWPPNGAPTPIPNNRGTSLERALVGADSASLLLHYSPQAISTPGNFAYQTVRQISTAIREKWTAITLDLREYPAAAIPDLLDMLH